MCIIYSKKLKSTYFMTFFYGLILNVIQGLLYYFIWSIFAESQANSLLRAGHTKKNRYIPFHKTLSRSSLRMELTSAMFMKWAIVQLWALNIEYFILSHETYNLILVYRIMVNNSAWVYWVHVVSWTLANSSGRLLIDC